MMSDRRDKPADPLITLRIERLADRIEALEAGSDEIERKVGELVTRQSKPKLRVVKEGDNA